MSRGNSSAFVAACMQPYVKMFLMIDLGFKTGTQYLVGLDYSVVYGGVTYAPGLNLINLENIEEKSGSAAGIKMVISGVGTAARAMARTERVQGQTLRIRLAIVTAAGVVVDDNVWLGTMDSMTLQAGTGSDTITITAEHIMAAWDRPSVVRWTDAQQQARSPGDLGLQYIAETASKSIVWPSKAYFQN